MIWSMDGVKRCIANFMLSFSQHILISFESSPIENNLANNRTSQQRDLYFNMPCRYPGLASENVRVYVIFGYIRNSITRFAW